MNTFSRTVLITGTTSGIGLSLMKYYVSRGDRVIAVNRRSVPKWEQTYPMVKWECLDITSFEDVKDFLRELNRQGFMPEMFVLNAGINRVDNLEGIDFATFKEVIDINFFGVMTFVAAIRELRLSHRKILAMSSTSNIVPNPAHIGYYLSKLSLKEAFRLLQTRDNQNTYQTVVLGPVHTNIMAGYPSLQGFQAKLFNFLAVSSETAASKIANFLKTNQPVLHYPKVAWLFYELVKRLLYFFPLLYRGTSTPKLSESSAQ